MADLTLSANMDSLLASADYAAARSNLGLTTLATTTPGTGVATALAVNIGTAGAFVVLNGAGGTPSSIVLTNATGTAASLTAGTASAVAVGGVTGLGTGVATALAVNTGSAGAFVVLNGAGGTPSSLTLTNATGLPTAGLVDDSVTLAKIQNAAASSKLVGSGASGSGVNYVEITLGTNLSMSGTTLNATSGGGGISGPGTTTDNAIVLWNATDGTVVQDSPVLVDPVTGDITNVGDITGNGLAVTSLTFDGTSIAGVTGTGDMVLNTDPGFSGTVAPITSDTAALGSGTAQWSDLFLASGALINFANGNAVITHSSAILTVSTGDLRVTTAGTNSASCVTVGGNQTLTSKTLTSPTLTTPSAFTTGGTITLAETHSIALDPAGSADGRFTGITVTGTAGYTQAFGDVVYLDPTDSRWEACDANSAAGADGDSRGMVGMVVSAGTDGTSCTILLMGIIRADAKFPTFTVNNPIYISETAASVTQTQPTTTDAVIRIIGAALTADEMYFNPDFTWDVHV